MGRRGIELEVKFAPAGEATLADLAAREAFPGWRVAGRHDEAQRNTYYDTAAGALEAARCSLRRRVLDGGAGGVEWTFKRGRGPGRDGVARRREVNAFLPATAGASGAAPPECKPVARARKVAGAAPLLPLFTLLTERRQLALARPDGTRLALALDRVRLADEPAYQEAEIEIELLDGDEGGLAELALWLMEEYGLLPMRGSKRGRALAWRRGEGLPVVAPALGLRLIAERVAALASHTHGRPVVVALASPRGSGQARALAAALLARLPDARPLAAGRGVPPDLSLGGGADGEAGTVIVEGPDRLGAEAGHSDLGVWVKPGLPRPLLAQILGDARAAGRDPWEILRRCGEYVVPLQRRYLNPAAHWADLIVIDNAPPPGPPRPGTPPAQVKLWGWPSEAALAAAGAAPLGADREEDHFFRPPADPVGPPLRVRLREDAAWVSFAAVGVGDAAPPPIVTCEARPRVLTLLHGLGYTPAGRLCKERRRYGLDGWELALDRVAGLGHFCELRRPDAGTVGARERAAVLAALGLAGIRTTGATYLELWREARAGATPPATGDAAPCPPLPVPGEAARIG